MSERSWLRRRGGSRAELSRAGQLLRAAPQQRAAVRSLARSAPWGAKLARVRCRGED